MTIAPLHRIMTAMVENGRVQQALLHDQLLHEQLQTITKEIVKTFNHDGKVLFCGNGGSAADAQHLAAELSGRFYLDRKPLFAEALHVNTSFLTAVANDYGYEEVFARAVEAMGRKGDILFALSTSGQSANILKAISAAKKKQMLVVGMTGSRGGGMEPGCDILLKVPSDNTPRIQEAQLLLGHIICELAEAAMFLH